LSERAVPESKKAPNLGLIPAKLQANPPGVHFYSLPKIVARRGGSTSPISDGADGGLRPEN